MSEQPKMTRPARSPTSFPKDGSSFSKNATQLMSDDHSKSMSSSPALGLQNVATWSQMHTASPAFDNVICVVFVGNLAHGYSHFDFGEFCFQIVGRKIYHLSMLCFTFLNFV